MTKPRKAKSKQVPQVTAPPTKEVPFARCVAAVTGEPGSRHPAWGLSLLDLEYAGEWSWTISDTTLHEIRMFLAGMERHTWTEIREMTHNRKKGAGHRSHKSIPVASLCKEARDRLINLRFDDADEVFEFRVAFRRRLWGVMGLDEDGRYHVFHALWWDPEHKVYPLDPA